MTPVLSTKKFAVGVILAAAMVACISGCQTQSARITEPYEVARSEPSVEVSVEPSEVAQLEPSVEVSVEPSEVAQLEPSFEVSVEPSEVAQLEPSFEVSVEPSEVSQLEPSFEVSVEPSEVAQLEPSFEVSVEPSEVSQLEPSVEVSVEPSEVAQLEPSVEVSVEPSHDFIPRYGTITRSLKVNNVLIPANTIVSIWNYNSGEYMIAWYNNSLYVPEQYINLLPTYYTKKEVEEKVTAGIIYSPIVTLPNDLHFVADAMPQKYAVVKSPDAKIVRNGLPYEEVPLTQGVIVKVYDASESNSRYWMSFGEDIAYIDKNFVEVLPDTFVFDPLKHKSEGIIY